MVKQEDRIKAFVKLGDFFRQYIAKKKEEIAFDSPEDFWFSALDQAVVSAGQKNPWFTREQVEYALITWGDLLTLNNLNKWLSSYNLTQTNNRTVAIVMAGNIPLVGFHDFLCTIITGNKALIKSSSNDTVLLPMISLYLKDIEPGLSSQIEFTEGRLTDFDAVIATGSNNTARYFEHYFGKKPNIIRRNRNSIAILSGEESDLELKSLGEDIFRYYGLGCRNVSKLYVPEGYKFNRFFESIESYNYLNNQHKYVNNYDYNKAVYLMSEFSFLDNGFFILKEDKTYASPIATVFYEFYSDLQSLTDKLQQDSEQLQCIIGSPALSNTIPFGSAQLPTLKDYADGIDTVEFLLKTS